MSRVITHINAHVYIHEDDEMGEMYKRKSVVPLAVLAKRGTPAAAASVGGLSDSASSGARPRSPTLVASFSADLGPVPSRSSPVVSRGRPDVPLDSGYAAVTLGGSVGETKRVCKNSTKGVDGLTSKRKECSEGVK